VAQGLLQVQKLLPGPCRRPGSYRRHPAAPQLHADQIVTGKSALNPRATGGQKKREEAGSPYCMPCWLEQFAPVCNGCNKKIEGSRLKVGDKVRETVPEGPLDLSY
jgi:hypothetical protein